MIKKFSDASRRYPGWDYSAPSTYFITICTKNRKKYFGRFKKSGLLFYSEIGEVAKRNWFMISDHFPFVTVDEFVIMPDHIHGILFFEKTILAKNLSSYPPYRGEKKKNKFGPQSRNLGSVIRGYKASVKAYATTNRIDFSWQSGYDDRIVESFEDLELIRDYIRRNPGSYSR